MNSFLAIILSVKHYRLAFLLVANGSTPTRVSEVDNDEIWKPRMREVTLSLHQAKGFFKLRGF